MRSRSAKGLALPFAQSIDLLGRLRFPEIDNTTNWLVYLVPKKTEILWCSLGRFHARSPCTRPNCRKFPRDRRTERILFDFRSNDNLWLGTTPMRPSALEEAAGAITDRVLA